MRVFPLIVGEAALLTIVALGLGTALLFGLPAVTQSVNTTRLGVFTPVNGSAAAKRAIVGAIAGDVGKGTVAGAIGSALVGGMRRNR